MLPLGGEIAAEIEAALSTPGTVLARLDPLLAQLAGRLAHGLGFALLRGLPLPPEPAVLLGLLGSRMGRPVHAPPPAGRPTASGTPSPATRCCCSAARRWR
ncbi:Fe(II)-2OG oxygenase family protein [Teichococcus aestuarii]|uniref:hypothetical protein n=1 Tax=Teichococcus aestuarii TaxID=568898 RepID=UPI00361F3325